MVSNANNQVINVDPPTTNKGVGIYSTTEIYGFNFFFKKSISRITVTEINPIPAEYQLIKSKFSATPISFSHSCSST